MNDFDLMNYLNVHGSPVRTVFGSWETGLGHGDFLYLDYVLYHNEHIRRFIDLGTMHGLSTLYLGVVAALRNGSVKSYDIVDLIPSHIKEVGKLLPIEFYVGGALDDEAAIREIGTYASRANTLLLCDNGKKEREIQIFSPYLSVGSVLMSHDCWTEVHEENISAYLTKYEPLYHGVAEKMNAHLRAWRRV